MARRTLARWGSRVFSESPSLPARGLKLPGNDQGSTRILIALHQTDPVQCGSVFRLPCAVTIAAARCPSIGGRVHSWHRVQPSCESAQEHDRTGGPTKGTRRRGAVVEARQGPIRWLCQSL